MSKEHIDKLIDKINSIVLKHKVDKKPTSRILCDNIDELFLFTNRTETPTRGVYFIGDYYVGKSNNIPRRLLEHLFELILREYPNFVYPNNFHKPSMTIIKNDYSNNLIIENGFLYSSDILGYKFNNNKLDKLLESFLLGKIKVEIIDDNEEKEVELINHYYKTHKLTNVLDVSYEVYSYKKLNGIDTYDLPYFDTKLEGDLKFKEAEERLKTLPDFINNWDWDKNGVLTLKFIMEKYDIDDSMLRYHLSEYKDLIKEKTLEYKERVKKEKLLKLESFRDDIEIVIDNWNTFDIPLCKGTITQAKLSEFLGLPISAVQHHYQGFKEKINLYNEKFKK